MHAYIWDHGREDFPQGCGAVALFGRNEILASGTQMLLHRQASGLTAHNGYLLMAKGRLLQANGNQGCSKLEQNLTPQSAGAPQESDSFLWGWPADP